MQITIRYLEQRDLNMHVKAKAQIKECYEKNKIGDPNFRSLTLSMKTRLRQMVGEAHWKKAQEYLDGFLKHKQQTRLEDQSSKTIGYDTTHTKEKQPTVSTALIAELSEDGRVLQHQQRGSTELAALIAKLPAATVAPFFYPATCLLGTGYKLSLNCRDCLSSNVSYTRGEQPRMFLCCCYRCGYRWKAIFPLSCDPLTDIAHVEYEQYVMRSALDDDDDVASMKCSTSTQFVPSTPVSNGTSRAVHSSPCAPPIPSVVGGSNFIPISDKLRNW